MGAEDEPQGFFFFPRVSIARRAEGAVLVHGADGVPVGFVVGLGGMFLGFVGGGRDERARFLFHGLHEGVVVRVVARWVGARGVGDIEGILQVAGGVLLRDEEGVEVPEAGFDEAMR